MTKQKDKKQIKNHTKKQKEKVKRNPDEGLATAGGFLYAGGNVFVTQSIPETPIEWLKFIGMFVLVSVVLYVIIYNGKRIYKKNKAKKNDVK